MSAAASRFPREITLEFNFLSYAAVAIAVLILITSLYDNMQVALHIAGSVRKQLIRYVNGKELGGGTNHKDCTDSIVYE